MGWKEGIVFFSFISALLIPREAVYPASSQEITVSAAMALKSSFEEIGKAFGQSHPGVRVFFNFGASGDLKKQIEAGAPVAVFAPASLQDMDELERARRIIKGTRLNFVKNELVLIEPVHARFKLTSFHDLKRETVKKIAIVNPKTSPAGKYAEEILTSYNLLEAVRDKLVFGEHVRQILDYVAREEVDAGIVYLTDARLRSREVRVVMQAPESSHTSAVYPIAVVRGAAGEGLAREFVDFVGSGEARQIFEQYGFKPLKE
jgi:molybdate transport system substrate-binding protein